MDLFEKALALAVQGHTGQADRNGSPYLGHVLRVMQRAQTPKEKIIALLHDLVEDTPITLAQLRQEGFPEDIVQAVDHLTRRDTETYEEFVTRSAAHPLARRVKICDLEDNMDIRRLKEVTEADLPRLNRYLAAYRKLIPEAI